METINELSFEQAFDQLEEVIARLESGELSLEESVTLYEQGKQLSARCQQLLDDAELARRMGAAGIRLMREEFSVQGMVAGNLALYRSLLNRDPALPCVF